MHGLSSCKAYEAARTIQQKLADAHPTITEYQSDLANSQINLGLLLSATGAPAEARKAYEAALAIQQKAGTGASRVSRSRQPRR